MATIEAAILNRVPGAVVVVDGAGRVLYLNEAAERMYGLGRGDAAGRSAATLGIHPPDDAAPAAFHDALAGGHTWEGTFVARRRDGARVRVHASVAPLYDADGIYVGMISVALPARSLRPPSADADARRIGRRIADARRAAGLTQRDLAAALGVARRSLQGYEAGTIVPHRHLDSLARILGRERSWFLEAADAHADADAMEKRNCARKVDGGAAPSPT